MTSISPAQARPPPLNLHPGVHRTHSKSGSQPPKTPVKEEKHAVPDHEADAIDTRPTKRRKTSSVSVVVPGPVQNPRSSAQGRYRSAPWSTVIRVNVENSAERGPEQSLPPLPEKPWGATAARESSVQDGRPTVRVRKNVAVPNTPDSIEIPSGTPLFDHKKRADYFPWTGKHPEDVLNDVHVKQGYFDRPPNPPDKELGTAKVTLYNAFKHKSGLDSLSALFSVVLDTKSKHGAFSSTSSFRGPPPRVTLTEVKRKSWISDLANPDVPLRKLSKTIPQGIRGPLLLEQCLQHNIPLGRAIWFTKCVGANEIRTLKRKGVNPTVAQGAELKWLREWTLNIEQFIESMLAQCGQPQWKEKIRYSILLAARLYLENLLDRDHYLDWILKSFAVANSNHWPFWLMIVHLHRLDLVAFRKKGKQLAENLISKYNAARTSPGDTLLPLVQNFAAAIRPLVSVKPNCFLMPDKWTECHKALTSILDVSNDVDRQILDRLKFVNTRSLGGVKQGISVATSPYEQVVEILDSFSASTVISSMYEALCQASPDQDVLMQQCLEWGTSRYRTGKSRTYLTARIFRKLRKQDRDVEQLLLDFVFKKVQTSACDLAGLKHLISELSRSQAFPFSKYMQWLSVRGMPRPGSISERVWSTQPDLGPETITIQESSDAAQMLTEVGLLHYEDHLVNLRNSLLNRAGFDEIAESTTFERLQNMVVHELDSPKDASTNTLRIWPHLLLEEMPWTIKTRLSYFLRQKIVMLAKASQTETPGKPPLPGARVLTLRRFCLVRNILERSGDIAILADVLRITSTTRQEDTLAAGADAINMHSTALAAIGALEPLQTLYGQTYVALRSVKTAMPLYATALINLCQQYPIRAAPLRALQQDFVRGDRGRAVTACSPFSDGVAESLQQASATFHDEFEAILQTESNMNDQTMVRLFKILIDRIEKMQHMEDERHELLTLCQLLARLKLCQRSQGELLVRKWITRLCGNHNQPISPQLLFSLVCTRCVQLEVYLEICQQLPAASPSRLQFYSHVRRAMVNDAESNVDEALSYGFQLAVLKLTTIKPVDLLDIIGSDETGRASSSPLKPTLINAVLSNPELIKALSKPAWLVVSQSLSENLIHINSSDPPETQAQALANSAGPLSLPYCSLRMRMLCQNTATKNDENIQDNIANMLCAAVADPLSSLSVSPRTFQTILRATGPVISAKVRSNVEQAFFNALPKFLQSKGLTQPPLPTQEETEHAAAVLQQVVLVNADTAGSTHTSSISALVEKLTIYMKILGPSSVSVPSATASSPTSVSSPVFPPAEDNHNFLVASLDHLKFLLQMLCIKRPVFSTSNPQPTPTGAKTLQQDQIKLTGLLITIGTHPTWSSVLMSLGDRALQSKIHAAIDFAFDVAATLVDDLSDESRMFCARIMKDKIKDARVQWLLGSVNSFGSAQGDDVGCGYQVVHDSKGVMGEWKPKTWEMLEGGGSGDSCLGLGLFGAKRR